MLTEGSGRGLAAASGVRLRRRQGNILAWDCSQEQAPASLLFANMMQASAALITSYDIIRPTTPELIFLRWLHSFLLPYTYTGTIMLSENNNRSFTLTQQNIIIIKKQFQNLEVSVVATDKWKRFVLGWTYRTVRNASCRSFKCNIRMFFKNNKNKNDNIVTLCYNNNKIESNVKTNTYWQYPWYSNSTIK